MEIFTRPLSTGHTLQGRTTVSPAPPTQTAGSLESRSVDKLHVLIELEEGTTASLPIEVGNTVNHHVV